MTTTPENTELIARIGNMLEGHSFALRWGEHHEEVATRIVDEVLRHLTTKPENKSYLPFWGTTES